jgi:hypothetical protein
MNGFVSKVQAEWCVMALLEELNRVVRQDVRHVAGTPDYTTVNVQIWICTLTLTAKTEPPVETGSRRIVVAHVPLAHERRRVACVVQEAWPRHKLVAQSIAGNIVYYSVRVSVLSREETCP